eukprot:15120232-Alexandrium_andersonii.AAC.1
MDEESVDQLLGRPAALVGAIVDQWQLDGGERAQRATDAVWSAAHAARDRQLSRSPAQAARQASLSPSGRR